MKRNFLTATAILLATPALAQGLGAHVHGHAQLEMALDPSGQLIAEFTTPKANLVGFEYEARTDEEKAAEEAAEARLLDGASILVFPEAAGCTLVSAELHEEGHEHHDDHGHEDHGHDEHDHDGHASHGHDDDKHEEHGQLPKAHHGSHGDHHDDHDDHADEHGHEDHEDTHSDVSVSYEFACAAPSAVTSVDVRLFEFFEGFEEIELVFLDENNQVARELTPSNTEAQW